MTKSSAQHTSTVDADEIARFSAMADEWWDERGKFAPLHRINPLRVEWIREMVDGRQWTVDKKEMSPLSTVHRPLQESSLLDIGCGGGLIAEPMARAGARVTAIDASEKNIRVAQLHAQKMGLSIDYRCTTAEALVEHSASRIRHSGKESLLPECRILNAECYDVVTALEIVEHVADIPAFVKATCDLVKPGGMIFYSTLNRTAKSYALAIVGAEYVLRWVPKGTHTWSKFVKPHELVRELEKNGIEITDMRGMVMHPLTFEWRWDAHDLGVNYAVCGRKVLGT